MIHRPRIAHRFLAGTLSLGLVAMLAAIVSTQGRRVAAQGTAASAPLAPEQLLNDFRHVEVASVSDAAEQILGKKIYMSHRMQAIFPTKFAGYAVTVLLKKDEGNKDPNALAGMMAAIDGGAKDSVYVMTVEDGAESWMAACATSRNSNGLDFRSMPWGPCHPLQSAITNSAAQMFR